MNGITLLPRTKLSPSPTNPRKNFNAEKLKELAETIKQHGVLEPLLVRGLGNDRYEIIAGERRWRASELAGLKELPCIEKVLSEQEVLEIQYIENLQRDDLSAIEEAEGFAKLIKSGAYTAEKLAEKLGKSRAHVFARLKLCKLEGPIRTALQEGKISHLHAEDIAKWVPASHQAEAIKRILEGRYRNGDPMSVREAREYLQEEYSGDLNQVAWELRDKSLVAAAGPCTTCPKRSDNCKAEFPDLEPNTCTDLSCFQQKRVAFQAQALAVISKKEKVLTIDQCQKVFDQWGYLTGKGEFIGANENLGHEAGYKSLKEVLKKPKAEKFAAVNHKGEVSYVYKRAEIMAELKEAGALEKRGGEKTESKEDKAKREAKEKLDKEIEEESHRRIADALLEAVDKVSIAKGERALWLIVLRYSCFGDTSSEVGELYKVSNVYDSKHTVKAAEKWPDEKVRKYVIHQIICAEGYDRGLYDDETLEFAADLLKVDVKGITKKVREELTAKTRETLVHKVTHGKPLPGEKKAAKPAKVDRNGHSKDLPEEINQEEQQPGLKGMFTMPGTAAADRVAAAQRARWAQSKSQPGVAV